MHLRAWLFAFAGVLWVLVPLVAYAQGLVPCDGLSCSLCEFGQLVQNVINFLVGISIPIAVVMFGWAGVLMFANSGNEQQVTKGKKIFQSVFLGFVMVVGGWLVVQTVLSTLVKDSFWVGGSWNNLQCQSQVQRYNQMTQSVGNFIGSVLGTAPEVSVSTTYTCPPGFTPTGPGGSQCLGPTGLKPADAIYTPTYSVSNAPRGNCSENKMTSIWGSNAAAMGCIAQNESACGAIPFSTVDTTSRGEAISVGMYQINLSAHKLTCGDKTLDCPKAFSGRYTGSNKNVSIVNPVLYDQCVEAALDVSCNTAKAKELFASQNVLPWSARTSCGFN